MSALRDAIRAEVDTVTAERDRLDARLDVLDRMLNDADLLLGLEGEADAGDRAKPPASTRPPAGPPRAAATVPPSGVAARTGQGRDGRERAAA